MRDRLARTLHAAAALLLLFFAGAKIVAPSQATDRPAWMQAALVFGAALELAVAAWLLVDWTTPRPLVAGAVLGAAFVVAALAAPAAWNSPEGCGCLGAVRLARGHRLVAGAAVLVLCGAGLMLAPSGGTLARRPPE